MAPGIETPTLTLIGPSADFKSNNSGQILIKQYLHHNCCRVLRFHDLCLVVLILLHHIEVADLIGVINRVNMCFYVFSPKKSEVFDKGFAVIFRTDPIENVIRLPEIAVGRWEVLPVCRPRILSRRGGL